MKEIQLTQNQVALVDDDDYEQLSKHKWCAHWQRYGFSAVRDANMKSLNMSVAIMQPPVDMEVDHVNGRTLDNQRSNLRIVTHAQNIMNRGGNHRSTSQFKGVSYCTDQDTWIAQIKPPGQKNKYLGTFQSEEEAARAYDAAAITFYDEYAFLNFPEDA